MTAPTTGPDSWANILDEGEKIIWQGRPDGGIVFKPRSIMAFVFGLFFAGFALFWMLMAASSGGFFWMFGLIHFSVGISLSFGSVFWGAWKRRHMWYTLTDQRAIIATNLPLKGRQLKSYPIEADTILDFTGGRLATLNFTHEMRRGKNRNYRIEIGFERIKDGDDVYRLMRNIQKKKQT